MLLDEYVEMKTS